MSVKRSKTSFKKYLLLTLLVAAAGLFASLMRPAPAYAYENNDNFTTAQQHNRTQLYAITRCFELSKGLQIAVSGSQINQAAIWSTSDDPGGNSNEIPLGYEIDPENGTRQCQNLDYDGALSFIGMTYHQFWKTAYGEPDADGNYRLQPGKSGQLHQMILDKLKAKRDGATDAVGPKEKDRRVLIGLAKCVKTTPDGKAPTNGKVPGLDGYEWRDGMSSGSVIPVGQDLTFYNPASGSPDDGTYTCGTLVNLGKGAIKRLPDGTTLEQAGAAGGGAGSTVDDTELGCDASSNPLSWIICPLINDLLVPAISATDNIITQQMVIPAQDIFCSNQDKCNDYYAAWSSFRDIALGLLAIAGLTTVIAQAIGMEILDAYTIRKILPRILMAAIGITLSWTLMNFAVTLSNNLGFGVRDLIVSPFHNLNSSIDLSFSGSSIVNLLGGFTALLIGGTLVAIGGLGIILSYVATAGLAVLIAIMVLVLRQIAVIMLMILSPVAFIAYVLPNTQRVFRLWWESFSKALLMFPLIAGFIAAGRVFAAISLSGNGGNATSLFNEITGFVAYFAPYFMIPMTFRLSGSMMGGLGNFVHQRGQPLAERLGKYRGEKYAANWKRARAGERWDKNFARFTNPITGNQTGIGHLANRMAVNVSDQDEYAPYRLGKRREFTNPLTGNKMQWKGMPGFRRGANDLQDQLDNRAITESQKALQEIDQNGGMHYEGWRGVSGQIMDFKGKDGNGVAISQRLADAGFVNKKTGQVVAPSSIRDFQKMGDILSESSEDKERLGGNDILQHAGTLASVKHRTDMEYADTQVMAAIAQSAAGRAEPEALANIGNSVQKRLGRGVAQRTMKAAQKAASRTERPDLRDGHGIIYKGGKYQSSYSKENYKGSTAIGSILSVKGSAWSGAKAEAVEAAAPTITHIARGGTGDAADAQAVKDMIRDGIRNPYNDAGQRKAWRNIAGEAGFADLVEAPPMGRQEWDQMQLQTEPEPEPQQEA